mgnify:FL=1
MQGECFLVNFADDFVAGFQYKSEAERYYKELKERMRNVKNVTVLLTRKQKKNAITVKAS